MQVRRAEVGKDQGGSGSSASHLLAPLIAAAIVLGLIPTIGCSDRRTTAKPPAPPFLVNPAPAYINPIWSTDGQRLYFNYRPLIRIYEESPNVFVFEFADSLEGFYVSDLQGQNKRMVFPRGLGRPEMSHDGRYLFYDREGQIWRVTAQGDSFDLGSETQITNSSLGAFGASVSYSNSRLLFFTGGAAGISAGVYLTSTDGGSARHIGGVAWHDPDWHPSDSAFAFRSYGDVITGLGVVDTFGAGALELRKDAIWPKWSPDGARIAFVPPDGRLWVMNRDGTNPREVTNQSVAKGYDWSPDGTRIAYVRYEQDTSFVNGTIWTVNPDTKETTQITVNERK